MVVMETRSDLRGPQQRTLKLTHGVFGGNAAQGGNGGDGRTTVLRTIFGSVPADIANPGDN